MSDSPSGQFVITKQYKRFVEFCDACRQYRYIGLCFGPPGVGKTWSARYYADWDRIEVLQKHMWNNDFQPPPEIANRRTVFYTPTVANTPRRIETEVDQEFFQLTTLVQNVRLAFDENFDRKQEGLEPNLILVDEANRLKMPGLEQIRDIYDRRNIGLVLIGMPGLEKSLSRYPQLYSRIGFIHPYDPLSLDEMQFTMRTKWQQLGLQLDLADFTDNEALAAIARITGGNFRLIQRLFAQIERIMQINELHTVTKEVVDAARKSLVIGPLA